MLIMIFIVNVIWSAKPLLEMKLSRPFWSCDLPPGSEAALSGVRSGGRDRAREPLGTQRQAAVNKLCSPASRSKSCTHTWEPGANWEPWVLRCERDFGFACWFTSLVMILIEVGRWQPALLRGVCGFGRSCTACIWISSTPVLCLSSLGITLWSRVKGIVVFCSLWNPVNTLAFEITSLCNSFICSNAVSKQGRSSQANNRCMLWCGFDHSSWLKVHQ